MTQKASSNSRSGASRVDARSRASSASCRSRPIAAARARRSSSRSSERTKAALPSASVAAGSLIEAPAVADFQAAPIAREREGLVAERADPVLGLPEAAALDADSRAHGVMRTEPEKVAGRGPRRRFPLDGVAEEQRELGPERTKVALGREGEVDLQIAGKQKDAVDRRPKRQVEQVHRTELAGDLRSPIGQHRVSGGAVGEAEGQIQVRPAVAAALCQRSDLGAGHDASVRLRDLQQAIAHTIALLDGEH
jgi:hypothetical protein